MPQYTTTLVLARPVADVFAVFVRPAQLLALAPPELHLQLLDGPERMHVGALLRWKARRWGVSQQIVSEVTALEENVLIVEEQRQGPFARWELTRRFEAAEEGTRLHEQVAFEPPRGMLGRLVTVEAIRADLEKMFAHREGRLRELLE